MINILYKDEDSWLGYTTEEGLYILHMETNPDTWSLSQAKRFYHILVNALKDIPAQMVFSVCKTNKAVKFNQMYGFDVIEVKDNLTLMGLQNVWFK